MAGLEDLEDCQRRIRGLERKFVTLEEEGLLLSFDLPQGTVLVDREAWCTKPETMRRAVAADLAQYSELHGHLQSVVIRCALSGERLALQAGAWFVAR